jgi:hypothetical protein
MKERSGMSFGSKYKLFDVVDRLPEGPKWKRKTITIFGGDKVDVNGKAAPNETADLWMRDPVECAAILLGNPAFKGACKYASEHTFATDKDGIRHRTYGEMWSGDWWKEVEVCWPNPNYTNPTNLICI